MTDKTMNIGTTADTHTSALVTTEWLQANLDAPNLCIVEATSAAPASAEQGADAKGEPAYIPGARVLELKAISEPDSILPNTLPQPERFSRFVSELGIDNDTLVVLYDAQGILGAARAWWMFRTFGHTRVAVLDGGLSKWVREQRPVEFAPRAGATKDFKASSPGSHVRTFEQMTEAVSSGEQIVDARSPSRFQGLEEEPRQGLRKGHIPGSMNLPYVGLLNSSDGTLIKPENIAVKFISVGVDLDSPVICSCGSGVSACVLALALHEIGHDQVSVYDGSWSEWGAHPETSVETGP